MTKVVRFLTSPDDPPLTGSGAMRRTRAVSLHLDGLPAPRYAAVEVAWIAGSLPTLAPTDVAVDEEIRRGAARVGEGAYRMMSVARRNPSLSRTEFADRWRVEAGNLGGEMIPVDVQGLAYVQDHPVGPNPAFDAINEVWFDSLDDLRRRAEWFAARPVPAELFDPAASFALYLRAVAGV